MAREYPHDLVAERSLLGSMLISSDTCQNILSLASKDDFIWIVIVFFLRLCKVFIMKINQWM